MTCATTDKDAPEVHFSLRDVHFSYQNGTEALRGVTLDIRAGEHVCVLGGNGSGKSTLVQLMNALAVPTSGQVVAFGRDTADEEGALAARENAALVFQHPEDQIVATTVADDVAFGPENLGLEPRLIAARVDEALERVGMRAHAGADPARLSGGQQQRVAIAGALAMRPRALLLDEPGAMLDVRGRRAIRTLVRELNGQGITVVHVTHFMDEALEAGRVVVLDRGRVALDGTPDEVFAHAGLLRSLKLDMPVALRLSEKLAQAGVPVAPTARAGELVDAVGALAAGRRTNTADGKHAATGEKGAHRAGASAGGGDDTRPGREPKMAAPTVAVSACNAGCEGNAIGAGAPTPAADSTLVAGTAHAPGTHANQPVPAVRFEDVAFSHAARPHKHAARSERARGRDAAAPRALDGLSFTAPAGGVTALVGHTGSGKSTALELACALRLPTEGRVETAGVDTADMARRRELRARVGYVAQLPERQLFAETVYDDVAFGVRNLDLAEEEVARRVERALETVGLADRDLWRLSPFALSGGQQRSAALAGILAMEPGTLVLDEPMAGLDPAARRRALALLARLREQGTSIVLITHSMDDVAALADHVVVLERGRVALEGAPRQVFARSDELRRIGLGVPSALRLANELREAGVPLAGEPLTLDALAADIAGALQSGEGQGAACAADTAGASVAQAATGDVHDANPATASSGTAPDEGTASRSNSAPAGGTAQNTTVSPAVDIPCNADDAPDTGTPHRKHDVPGARAARVAPCAGTSPVHRLDPRVKLLAAVAYMASCLAVDDLPTLALSGGAVLACVAVARVSLRELLRSLRAVVAFLLVTSVVNLVFVQTGMPVVELGFVRVTADGLSAAALYTLRFLFLLLAGALLMLTSTPTALTDAAERLLAPLARLGVPVHDFALVLSIALRFVPVLRQEAHNVAAAQTARGADLEGKGAFGYARACVPLLVPLFAASLRHAENLGRAMDARCYRGGEGRTHYHVLRLSARRDAPACALVLLYLAALAAMRLAL